LASDIAIFDISNHQNLSSIFVVKQGYVLFLIRQHIYNSRYYQKKDKRTARKELEVQADKDDHERIYKQLEVELKKKKEASLQ